MLLYFMITLSLPPPFLPKNTPENDLPGVVRVFEASPFVQKLLLLCHLLSYILFR